MNNFILINRTYTETTPESCEIGDFSDAGFIEQDQEVTFSELVSLMKEHNQPSERPTNCHIHTWFSCYPYISDYRTGTEREESIHFSSNNTPNAEKYWKLAYKVATK